MFYLFITIIIVWISGFLFKRGCGTISVFRPNMMSVIFYYYFILQCVVGSVLIVNQIDHHYMVDKLQYVESRYYGYAAVMYTIIAFPIGMIIANKTWHIGNISRVFDNYCKSKIKDEKKYGEKPVKYSCIFISLLAFCSVIYVTYVIGEISLIKLFSKSSALDLSMFRTEASREFNGNIYIRNIFAIGFTPLMSYVAYAYKLKDNSTFNKVWFWSMLIASLQIVSYNLEKSPIIVYLLGFLFFRIYMGKQITRKQLLILILVILSLIIGMYAFLMQEGLDFEVLFAFNTGIIGRITLSSIAGLFLSFDIWPSSVDFIGFSSLSQLLSNILGTPYIERSARIIMEMMNPQGVQMGTAGVMNTLFVGEAWANWGITGVVLSPMIVGFLIQSLYIFFLKSPKTPFFLAFFVNFSFKSAITGGFNDYIYNAAAIENILLILSIYILSILFNNRFCNEKKNYFSPTLHN